MIKTTSNLRAECRVGVMSIVCVYNYTFQNRNILDNVIISDNIGFDVKCAQCLR